MLKSIVKCGCCGAGLFFADVCDGGCPFCGDDLEGD